MHDGLVEAASAFNDVALDNANQALVGICINKYFQVECLAERQIREYQNTFNDQHVAGLDGDSFPASPASDIGIDRHLHRIAHFQLIDMFNQQRPFNGRGMVEIDFLLLFLRQVAIILIVGILTEHADALFREALNDFFHHGGLS